MTDRLRAPRVNVIPRGPTVVTGTNQAANTEVSEAVPAGEIWELLSVTVVLVQGGTQTPQPVLQITDGSSVVYESLGASGAQSADTTARYTWAVGSATSALIGATPNIHAFAPLPAGLVLAAGWVVQTSTVGKGANTDYGAPVLLVCKL